MFSRKISLVSTANGSSAVSAAPPRRGVFTQSSPLAQGLKALRPAVRSVVVFSLFMNLLMFVSPLYMLQIYDRVMTSRSIETLTAITVLAGVLLAIYGLLEAISNSCSGPRWDSVR